MLCVTTSAPCIQQPCHAWYARMGFAGNQPDQPDTAWHPGARPSMLAKPAQCTMWGYGRLALVVSWRTLRYQGNGAWLTEVQSPAAPAQLQTLSFAAPLLTGQEWDTLLLLRGLTELRINDWRAPVGRPTQPLVPGEPGQPSVGFDLRPLVVHGTPRTSDAVWLKLALHEGSRITADPLEAAAEDEDGMERQDDVAALGAAKLLGQFSQLHALRACLTSHSQLAYLVSQPLPSDGLPLGLRSLHIAFTDKVSSIAAQDVTAVSDAASSSTIASATTRLGAAACFATPGQLKQLLPPDSQVLPEGCSQEVLWEGLARCCP